MLRDRAKSLSVNDAKALHDQRGLLVGRSADPRALGNDILTVDLSPSLEREIALAAVSRVVRGDLVEGDYPELRCLENTERSS
jgi:hypothetical protein